MQMLKCFSIILLFMSGVPALAQESTQYLQDIISDKVWMRTTPNDSSYFYLSKPFFQCTSTIDNVRRTCFKLSEILYVIDPISGTNKPMVNICTPIITILEQLDKGTYSIQYTSEAYKEQARLEVLSDSSFNIIGYFELTFENTIYHYQMVSPPQEVMNIIQNN